MTQIIAEDIYTSVTHSILQKPTTKNAKTEATLSQAVVDLSKTVSVVHQIYWYTRGAGLCYLHPKMDELIGSPNASLDEVSGRLITTSDAPYSALKESGENSELEETTGLFDKTMDEHLARSVDIYTYLSALYQAGPDVTGEEGDAPSNDIFTAAQADTEKTIWMLQAKRGQAPGIK